MPTFQKQSLNLLLLGQGAISRFVQRHGVHVCCSDVPRRLERYICSAGGIRGADSVLPRKSCRHVLGFTIRIWTGEWLSLVPIPEFHTLFETPMTLTPMDPSVAGYH